MKNGRVVLHASSNTQVQMVIQGMYKQTQFVTTDAEKFKTAFRALKPECIDLIILDGDHSSRLDCLALVKFLKQNCFQGQIWGCAIDQVYQGHLKAAGCHDAFDPAAIMSKLDHYNLPNASASTDKEMADLP